MRWWIEIAWTNPGQLCGNRYVRFAQVVRNRSFLGFGKRPRFPLHAAGFERRSNCRVRHFLQSFRLRRAHVIVVVVTTGASRAKESCCVNRRWSLS